MNRGVDRQVVFRSDADRLAFLDLFAAATSEYGVEVHAYCLMDNHYHLLVHCPDGGLSAAVQQFASRYTKLFNWRSDRDGPLCRSRFRSRRIESVEYLANVSRYIHRNPLDRFDTPNLQALRRFRWSSYARYLGLRAGPKWCNVETVRGLIGDVSDYRTFVEGATTRPTDLGWAIDVAAFSFGLGGDAHLASTVRGVLLDRLGAPVTDATMSRSARYRARNRVANNPGLIDVAQAVIGQLDSEQRQALLAGRQTVDLAHLRRSA